MREMLTRFHAVHFCRFHSANIADKFAVVMPVLEEHIRQKYETKDEITYRRLEQAFFEWLDANASLDFREFSRKHLEVKKRKAPSLTTLLKRAISAINAKGFAIPAAYGERLKSRRGKHFHSIQQSLDAGDIRRFYDEIRAATSLLLLSTLDDLGIDISLIAKKPTAFKGLVDIVITPTASAAYAGGAEAD